MASLSRLIYVVPLLAIWLVAGPEWFAVYLIAIYLLDRSLSSVKLTLVATLPSLIWLGLSVATGNRELYFPFSIFLATQTGFAYSSADVWRGTVFSLFVLGGFLVVRSLQDASSTVLLLEFGVALTILQIALLMYLASRRGILTGITLAAIASVAGFVGLAI